MPPPFSATCPGQTALKLLQGNKEIICPKTKETNSITKKNNQQQT